MSIECRVGATIALCLLLAAPAQAEISQDEAGSIARQAATGQATALTVSRESKAINDISPVEDLYRVTMHGHFVYQEASPPAGYALPSGTLMEMLIERETGEVREVHIGGEATANTARLARAAKVKPKTHIATWGGNCKISNANHCYSVADWYMSGGGFGGGEEVEGDVVETDTTNMNVPEWSSGATVTNETWVAFHPSDYWLEIGTIAGYYVGDCCSLRWFYAKENGSGFTIWNTSGVITPNTWPWYWILAEGSGDWCWKIGEHGEATVACEDGFYTYSNVLEDGAEVASESEPTNAGHVVASFRTVNTGEWHTWNRAEPYVNSSHMCQSQFQPYPGNISYGTC